MASRFLANAVRSVAPMPRFTIPQPTAIIPTPQFHLNPQFSFMTSQKMAQTFSLQKPAPLSMKSFSAAVEDAIEFTNRNKRKPRRANHGARPCSSVSRSKKKLRRHHYPK